MAVPNTFASATTSIPLANLDANFTYYDGAFNIAANVFTFLDTVQFQDAAAPTKIGAFSFAGITAGTTVTYTFPNITGTLATLGNLAQSFAGAVTVSNAFTVTGTTTSTSIQSTQSTGTITVGGTAGTGAITLGRSTGAQTLNIATGATTAATTKAINIGTTGVSTSVTNITSGSSVAGALVTHTWNAGTQTMTLNASGNVGIGTSLPSEKLEVAGNAKITGSSLSIVPSTTTTSASVVATNTGGNFFFGIDNSTGASFGAGAYGRVLYSSAAYPMAFFTNGTERMRIDSSGNVGIGTSSPSTLLHVSSASTDGGKILIQSGTLTNNNRATLFMSAINVNGQTGNVSIECIHPDNQQSDMVFRTGATDATSFGTERMRINTSGNVIVGSTATIGTGGKLQVTSATDTFYAQSTAATTYAATVFNVTDTAARLTAYQYGSGGSPANVGSVTTNGTTVAYNTSSDYRLKKDIAPMTGALAKVALLKPVTYKWKSNGSDAEGFIAHELAEVCPAAVHGVKDAVNKDGNPEYQGIDVSFLVATLTAAIQEQQALITSLTARITALEST